MKLIAHFFLILFIAFLSTPTIVKLIEDNTDTTMIISVFEEEHAKKEVKNLPYNVASTAGFQLKIRSIKSLIISENFSKQDKISRQIFSPPPNLI